MEDLAKMSISQDYPDPPGQIDDVVRASPRGSKKVNKELKHFRGKKSEIEIRDCFNEQGVLIYFSFDAIFEIIAEKPETVALLLQKLIHCKNWKEYVKKQRTKRILARSYYDNGKEGKFRY